MRKLFLLLIVIAFQSCQSQSKENKPMDSKSKKTDAEWKADLTPEQYEVLRNKGTERAFTKCVRFGESFNSSPRRKNCRKSF